jgi:hypothetical protein
MIWFAFDGIESSHFTLVHRVHETALSKVSHNCTYLAEAVWRTLIADRSVNMISPCPRDYYLMYKEVVEQATQSLTSPNRESKARLNTRSFLKAMGMSVHYSLRAPYAQFLITGSGLVGPETPDCERDDFVCVLRGCSMPVIMRRQRDSYAFLGCAYIHGIISARFMLVVFLVVIAVAVAIFGICSLGL